MKKSNASIALAVFTVIAVCLATSAVAKKPKDPGGTKPACFLFQEGPEYMIGSDLPGVAYCDDKQAKVAANLTADGHLALRTRAGGKVGSGRSLYIDWSLGPGPVPLRFGDEWPGGYQNITSTLDLDAMGIPHNSTLFVGAFNDAIDLRTMQLHETWTDASVRVGLGAYPEDPQRRFGIFMRFEPYGTIDFRSCPAYADSTLVDVTCNAVTGGPESQCYKWTVEAYFDPGLPEPGDESGDLACAGLDYELDNESYYLPFRFEAQVME